MIRKQIYLDPDDEDQIKQLSRRLDTSESELIRQAIREFLRQSPQRSRRPMESLVGQSDVEIQTGSTEHDQALGQQRLDDLSGESH